MSLSCNPGEYQCGSGNLDAYHKAGQQPHLAAQPVHLTTQPFYVGFRGQVLIRAFQSGHPFFSVCRHLVHLTLRCPGRKTRHSSTHMVAYTLQVVKSDGNWRVEAERLRKLGYTGSAKRPGDG